MTADLDVLVGWNGPWRGLKVGVLGAGWLKTRRKVPGSERIDQARTADVVNPVSK